jgi:asparagine synthase (glutamine-hydrolysing)
MCGIAGVFSHEKGALLSVRRMADALRHRGPDDEGYLFADVEQARVWRFSGASTAAGVPHPRLTDEVPDSATLALANRRLAILDPSPAGHGPMGSSDGRLWITYNGEIFNYLELRDELATRGLHFSTGTDTEVLLAAYAEWDTDALARLNGMFAFALYDAPRRRLLCVRDRFGVKPFHYFWDGSLFAFASEIKGLLAHPSVPCRSHTGTELSFLVSGGIDEGEQTFFEGIRRLSPGHLLDIDLTRPAVEPKRWYRLPRDAPRPPAPGEFRALLEDAVRLRLRSDVPVGTCLSGGLDSSSIVGLTAALRGGGTQARKAFSIVYPIPGLDESAYVDEVVALTGVESHRATPTAQELARDLDALVRAQEEPFPSAGPYSQWRVMQLARAAGVTVLLDGQGADEVLGGYHYHYGPFLAEIARTHGLPAAFRSARQAAEVTGRPLGFFVALLGYHGLPLPMKLRSLALARGATHGRVPPGMIDPDVGRSLDMRPHSERHRARPSLCAERRANLEATSLPALLRYEDRNSMAFSVEARTPFLDYRLVERALAFPAESLIHEGWTKNVLREAARGLVPESVRLRRDKLGFATPEKEWLTTLAPRVRDWLGPEAQVRGLLRKEALAGWLAAPDGDLAARPGLWRLVSLELWRRALPSRLA